MAKKSYKNIHDTSLHIRFSHTSAINIACTVQSIGGQAQESTGATPDGAGGMVRVGLMIHGLQPDKRQNHRNHAWVHGVRRARGTEALLALID